LTTSVNAAAISPARQFLLFGPRCTRRALLTSDLGFARQGYEWAAVPTTATSTNENLKRLRKLLFLGLVTLVVQDGLC
jgi:hypothetical protein